MNNKSLRYLFLLLMVFSAGAFAQLTVIDIKGTGANQFPIAILPLKGEEGLPLEVTASFEEAGRWMDGGHSVDSVAMPAEIFAWVGDYVEKNYRPEPKKRIKPRSFVHPKDRM